MINQIWTENIDVYTKKEIEFIINSFVNVVGQGIKNGLQVKVEGLGTFSPYTRKTKVNKNVNENNNSNLQKYISFKPSRKLKE